MLITITGLPYHVNGQTKLLQLEQKLVDFVDIQSGLRQPQDIKDAPTMVSFHFALPGQVQRQLIVVVGAVSRLRGTDQRDEPTLSRLAVGIREIVEEYATANFFIEGEGGETVNLVRRVEVYVPVFDHAISGYSGNTIDRVARRVLQDGTQAQNLEQRYKVVEHYPKDGLAITVVHLLPRGRVLYAYGNREDNGNAEALFELLGLFKNKHVVCDFSEVEKISMLAIRGFADAFYAAGDKGFHVHAVGLSKGSIGILDGVLNGAGLTIQRYSTVEDAVAALGV